ncbi:conserved Plasmodium protein, unknown function [Rhizophagus irregularis DAOM 181602=DAOM 197198]|nr:conserved Plasmodium protein, unknown function [Rhizophagus irregularis DAOM 181602=DAOM 197198]
MKHEVKNKMEHEVKNEMEHEVKNEMEHEVKNEMEYEIKNEMERKRTWSCFSFVASESSFFVGQTFWSSLFFL